MLVLGLRVSVLHQRDRREGAAAPDVEAAVHDSVEVAAGLSQKFIERQVSFLGLSSSNEDPSSLLEMSQRDDDPKGRPPPAECDAAETVDPDSSSCSSSAGSLRCA